MTTVRVAILREFSRSGLVAFLLVLPAVALADGPTPPKMVETPQLEEIVARGELPPADQRIPSEPSIVPGSGTQGSELRMLMSSAKDTRLMVVYGYARLVGYTPIHGDRARHRQGGRR